MIGVPIVIGAKVNYHLWTFTMAEISEQLRLQIEKISEVLPRFFTESSEEEDHDDTDKNPNYEPEGQCMCI